MSGFSGTSRISSVRVGVPAIRACILAATVAAQVSGCSTVMPYASDRRMSFAEAKETAEELLLTQHETWRPDYIDITEKFISFDYGSSSVTQSFGGIGSTGLVLAKSKGTTRRNGGRVYYKYITKLELVKWQRKFKTWYVVRLSGDIAIRDRNILRTRDVEKARLLIDALESLVAYSRVGIDLDPEPAPQQHSSQPE